MLMVISIWILISFPWEPKREPGSLFGSQGNRSNSLMVERNLSKSGSSLTIDGITMHISIVLVKIIQVFSKISIMDTASDISVMFISKGI